MPFTLSHPAAVLPFVRGPFVPAALVAGSLAPDVPYYVPVPRSAGSWYEPFLNATVTHHWPGMLTAAVPTALVLVLAWTCVRAPLSDLLVRDRPVGAPVRRREPVPRAAARTVVSAVLGVLTHVVWDSVTHAGGFVVERVAVLQAPAFAGMDVARVLQHASTALGALVLLGWAGRRVVAWRAAGGRLGATPGRALVLGGLLAVALVAAVVPLVGALGAGAPLEVALFEAATTAGAVAVAAVLVHAAAWHAGRQGGRLAA